QHFRYEEEHLFPELAQAFPAAAAGPIPVMLSEHSQMRELFDDLGLAVRKRDAALLADTMKGVEGHRLATNQPETPQPGSQLT
ncbi:MAG: hemerythrin domain-containing protein, partial [Alphaproteobacteria bacterium]